MRSAKDRKANQAKRLRTICRRSFNRPSQTGMYDSCKHFKPSVVSFTYGWLCTCTPLEQTHVPLRCGVFMNDRPQARLVCPVALIDRVELFPSRRLFHLWPFPRLGCSVESCFCRCMAKSQRKIARQPVRATSVARKSAAGEPSAPTLSQSKLSFGPQGQLSQTSNRKSEGSTAGGLKVFQPKPPKAFSSVSSTSHAHGSASSQSKPQQQQQQRTSASSFKPLNTTGPARLTTTTGRSSSSTYGVPQASTSKMTLDRSEPSWSMPPPPAPAKRKCTHPSPSTSSSSRPPAGKKHRRCDRDPPPAAARAQHHPSSEPDAVEGMSQLSQLPFHSHIDNMPGFLEKHKSIYNLDETPQYAPWPAPPPPQPLDHHLDASSSSAPAPASFKQKEHRTGSSRTSRVVRSLDQDDDDEEATWSDSGGGGIGVATSMSQKASRPADPDDSGIAFAEDAPQSNTNSPPWLVGRPTERSSQTSSVGTDVSPHPSKLLLRSSETLTWTFLDPFASLHL